MIGRFDLAYAQTRIQARHGARPGADVWRHLHTSRDMGHFLEAARATSLRRWLARISEQSDVHAIERALRHELRAYTLEVAGWLPKAWLPSMSWTARLAELPLLERLLGPEAPPDWVALDPQLAPFAQVDRDRRVAAVRATDLAAVVDAVEAGRSAREGWSARWRELLPGKRGRKIRELHELAERVAEHLDRVPDGDDADGWRLRAALEADLARTFRWNALRPVAIWAHLGLVALDVEKLRGALVRRNLFPDTRSDVSWV